MKEELKKEFESKFIRPLTNDDNYMWGWRNIHFLDIIKWIDKNFVPVENRVSQPSELTCEQKLNDLANELSKEVIDKYKFINENKEPLIEGVLDEAEIEWFLYFKEKIKSFCEQP